MRFLLPTFFGVATFLASVLLWSQSCTAFHGDKASTSMTPVLPPAGSSASTPARSPPRMPLFQMERPDVNTYIKDHLTPKKLEGLQSTITSEPKPEMPFEGPTPLLNILAPTNEVRQALVDYGSIGLVDQEREKALYIQLQGGGILPIKPSDEQTQMLVTMMKLDPKVHKLKKAILGRLGPIRAMSSDEVDGLPHALGIPILTRGHDSYENMLAASRQEPRSFWLQHERRYLLIHPYQEVLFEEAVSHATDEINQALKGFRDYKDRYGRGYAGLRWGRPLNLETWPTSIKRPNIEKYERFGSGSASRQEMIQALKKHGRFRLYITSPAQSQSRDVPFKAYKAILQHSVSSGHGPSTTEVVIHPLTRKERFYEWLAKTAKRIKLPAMIPFGQEEVTNVDTILSPVRGDESEREGELAQSLQAGESVAGHIHV